MRAIGTIWHSKTIRGYLYQIIIVAVVICGFVFMFSNAKFAMEKRGISTGFGFLNEESGFAIGESLIPFSPHDTYLRAFAAAILNTLKVAALGVFLASLLGITIGMGRLSSNWFVRKLSSAYVELFRNTPQLVQIIFWYTLITQLPNARQAFNPIKGLFLCNRGLYMAWPSFHPVYVWSLVGFFLACVSAYLLTRWRERYRKRTGRYIPLLLPCLGMILGGPAFVWLIGGAPIAFELPHLKGFNFAGGVGLTPEFLGLLGGLTLYFAAFLAEIVRSGIQSVPKGQIEAAKAINLKKGFIFRLILFPQALRVMVPPAAAQFVSLMKTSSLGVAIGYPELFNVNNTITTLSGNTMECVAIMMAVYLALSFGISAVMNIFNNFIQIKER